MIYKLKSKAAADLILLGPHGDELMRLLGREAPSVRGIIEPAQMAEAIARLQAAIAAQESAAAGAGEPDATEAESGADGRPRALPLRTRLWPVIQMLERAQAAGEPVVWGV